MTAASACRGCGTEQREGARFCDNCGATLAEFDRPAEYKQVTVLFADVVHSMDIAAAVGAERLREIMAELLDRCSAVVHRYGGTVDKFTGDGVMALFGAPVALEDHAIRACLAAVSIQDAAKTLAADIERQDDITLQLRVGLNSGQVIAGEIGSTTANYTAVGEQVGMAQRMESAASPGGIMLSDTTARLAEHVVMLGEPELVHVKGIDAPVTAHRFLSMAQHAQSRRKPSTFVGRKWEMNTVAGIINQAIDSKGCVVSIVGEPGIGKSRFVTESTKIAKGLGAEVFWTFCESHASDIPFHVAARLLREVFEVSTLDDAASRDRIRSTLTSADPEDLLLLEDLLGIGARDVALPGIDPDARRRRLARLVHTAALARTEPAVYVIEDAHWIDTVSESVFAEFLSVIPKTQSMALITYRPEYLGTLSRTPGGQTIALAPLGDSQISALTTELLGSDPSVVEVANQVVTRAAGNPFFAEEIVRNLFERDVLKGRLGNYVRVGNLSEVTVPPTLQATIASRIDRIDPRAKRTLSAAAVIGARFGDDLLAAALGNNARTDDLGELIRAELIDQVSSTPRTEYTFRHPLIRTVAYESQLKSIRAEMHRRLGAALEQRAPGSVEENAALIAEHLEAGGELRAAFGWHMRAATWSTNRDLGAARTSWQRARQVADRLPSDQPGQMSMRIAPRSLLCASTWRAGGTVADAGFDELRELCTAADDRRALAIGMSGHVMELSVHNRHREASQLASECAELLESIGDAAVTVGLLYATVYAKYEAGEMVEGVRLAQRAIDLADGDPAMGNLVTGSPLAMAIGMRGLVGCCVGRPGWRDDFDESIAMARAFDPSTRVLAVTFKYVFPIPNGVLLPNAAVLQETAEALQTAERLGDDFVLGFARLARGAALVQSDSPDRADGFDLLEEVRKTTAREGFSLTALPVGVIANAREKARAGDVDGAIELCRDLIESMFSSGEMIWHGPAITVLVESLLRRGTAADLQEAQAAIDRLAAVPTDPEFVLHELPLLRLRALIARLNDDEGNYHEFRDRYRRMANHLGFEGHIAMADAMP